MKIRNSFRSARFSTVRDFAPIWKESDARHDAVDALFAVDIIQAFGVTPFDLPAQFVDVACGASHKWLCSPEGCGIFYLSDRARERIEPTLVGWISVETPWDFEDLEQNYKPNALAWETGTGPSSLFYGLEQSTKLLYETGAENIQKYLEELTDYLCEIISSLYYEIVSSRARRRKIADRLHQKSFRSNAE